MNLIFKCLYGSHLVGTDTPQSDRDYKGVFMESIDRIILQRDRSVIVDNTGNDATRNTTLDVDVELKELRSFIKDCLEGQTYAYDLLFAPRRYWLVGLPVWEDLIAHREKLLSKNVKPFIGYCLHQAGKYGLKGSRLAEVRRVIAFLRSQSPKQILGDAIKTFEFEQPEMTRLTVQQNRSTKTDETFFEVMGKKFALNLIVKECISVLALLEKKYGDRAASAAANEGIAA